jgi:gluconate 2-dehydrogenase subunit 3-like protein
MSPTNDHDTPELIQLETEPRSGVGRRAVLQSLLTGVGASVALPHLAEAHPIHDHLADQKKVTAADKKAAAPAYKPEFLDAHQYATLVAIAERVVPGSTKARVAPFIDQLLAVDTNDSQREFLGAMGAFEMQAIDKFGKPWKSLTAAQQDELLTAASTGESGMKTIGGDPRGRGGRREGKATSYDHFMNLRSWISGAYYSSEIGMRELGWTGEMFFTELPGCSHPDGHAG